MKDKIIYIFIVASFIVGLIGAGLTFTEKLSEQGEYLIQGGFTLAQWWGIYLIFKNGTTKNTFYWQIIRFLLGVLVFGVFFKIMHWPFAGIMLMVSLLGISFTYLVRFVAKNDFSVLSILKFLWVFSTGILSFLSITRIIPKNNNTISFIPLILFCMLFTLFLSQEYKSKKALK
ncbi:hypothetical protein Fleli_3241 [Bernardetia litoralis DSM 6794]|uniref:Gliding motility protein GldL-like N-terminal domain-containing protein n=1 Tax=Bernardetia litoralis (strain ATCC 23117 / DSM 6794 / NBRC 15988 / NCIMB 1366 / Fx l1 / Sio-4) TaxID=880071 RepID=I4ANN7_BERLS|nr:hypothetical protein [Bernardetia litoralis]AFM05572.1 hypothetical protein Fleli_3241 [Bernardetia litoralis DSM 6794]